MAIKAAQRHDLPEPDAEDGPGVGGLGFQKPGSIYDREDDYRRRRLQRALSPSRNDAYAQGDATPDARVRTYADVMREQQLQREMDNTMRNIADKKRKEAEAAAALQGAQAQVAAAPAQPERKRRRWDTAEPVVE